MELYEDDIFCARYRFTKETVRDLLAFLPIGANDANRGQALPPMLQLLVTLRFYGAGTFQIVAGDLVNGSQPTVCRTIKKVTLLIARNLFRVVVRFPGASKLSSVMWDFYEIAHFPGLTGCIDCTHVRIKIPGGDDAEVYRNRKGVFSVNVQVSALLLGRKRFIPSLCNCFVSKTTCDSQQRLYCRSFSSTTNLYRATILLCRKNYRNPIMQALFPLAFPHFLRPY